MQLCSYSLTICSSIFSHILFNMQNSLARLGRRRYFCGSAGLVLPMMPHLHFSRSIAIPGLSPISFISPSNRALQVILGLPLPLLPATSKFLQALTQSSTSFRSTCPNHLNLPRLITSTTALVSHPLVSYPLNSYLLNTYPFDSSILVSFRLLFVSG